MKILEGTIAASPASIICQQQKSFDCEGFMMLV